MAGYGHTKLWGWFGLSRATFLTLPRVLMHEMPDEWQSKMAELLDEYDATFPNQPDMGTRVQITQNGRMIATPKWLLDYRHPDLASIEPMRRSVRHGYQ